MKEYIYRESETRDGVITKIKVEELTRCKNCTHFVDKGNGITRYYCSYHKHGVKPECYCSYANNKNYKGEN